MSVFYCFFFMNISAKPVVKMSQVFTLSVKPSNEHVEFHVV